MAYWLVQCNTSSWRIRDFFTDGHRGTTWPIRQHWKRMSPGDGVAVWLSGAGGGVAALGHVTSEPHLGTPDAGYWSPAPGREAEQWLVPVEFAQHFVDHPIGRERLAADPRFEHALILRMSGGRNPFPLEDREWQAIVERVPTPGPQVVATAVRGAAVGAAVAVVAGASAVREAFRTAVR